MGHAVGAKTWVLFDQVLSSVTNFLAGIYAAHVLMPADFGVFALIQVCYVLSLGICRSLFTDVAMVSDSRANPSRLHFGAIDCVHLASSAGAIAVVAILSLTSSVPLVAIVLAVVGVTVALGQDAVRMIVIAIGRPRDAVLSDSLWLLTLMVLLPTSHYLNWQSPWAIAAVWGLSAASGLIVSAIRLRWQLNFGRGISFIRERYRLSGAFLSEWALKQGTTQVATYVIGLIGGITTVAGIRAAGLVLGPLNVIFTGLQLAILPSIVAKRDRSIAEMRYSVRLLGLVLGGASLLVGIALAAAPHGWLAVLVGNQAEGLHQYVLPLAVSLAATGLMTGSHMGLRVLGAGRELITVRLVGTLLTLVGGALGFVVANSVPWALWGLAIGGLVAVLPWESAFRQACRAGERHNPGRSADVASRQRS